MADEKKINYDLSPALKGKFKMVAGHHPGLYSHKGVEINFTTCTLAEAEAAHKNGIGVIEPESESKPDVKK